MRPLRLARKGLVAAFLASLLVGLLPNPALADKGCGHVHGKFVGADGRHYGHYRASVKVMRGGVSCRSARRVARGLFGGKAHFVDNGYGYNSYFRLGHWKGQYKTGGWVMTNRRRHARVGGQYSYG